MQQFGNVLKHVARSDMPIFDRYISEGKRMIRLRLLVNTRILTEEKGVFEEFKGFDLK